MSGIKKQASRGVFWSLAENVGMRGIAFLAFLVLARLLDKESFGLVSLAMVFIAFLGFVMRAAVTEVIVQRKNLSEIEKNTAFWVAAALGVVALLTSLIVAPYASIWSGEEELESILYWLSLGIIPLALTRVQDGLMMRDMRFKGLAARRLLGSGSGAIVGVACALNGLGVWSLVAQQLTDSVVDFLTLYWVAGWFPKFCFSWLAFKDMADYGWKIMGTNLAYFAGAQLDRLLVGYFLGVATLGVYVIGQRLIEVLYAIMNGVIGRVALSAFARIQTDDKRLKIACLAVGQLTAITAIPVFMFLAISAADVIQAVFGEKWTSSAIVTRVMAVAAIARLYFVFLIPALKAKGMAGRVMIAVIFQAMTSTLAAVILSPLGLGPITVGWSLGYGVSTAMLIYFVVNTTSISLVEMIQIYAAPLISAMIGGALIMLIDRFLVIYSISIYLTVIIELCLFVFGYLGFLSIIAPQTVKNAYSEISNLLLRK